MALGGNTTQQQAAQVNHAAPAPPTSGVASVKQLWESYSPWILLIVFGGLYLLFAFLHMHEKVQNAVKPGNIAANLHNLLVIFVAVCLSVPLALIGLAKLYVLVPGKGFGKNVIAALLEVVSNA